MANSIFNLFTSEEWESTYSAEKIEDAILEWRSTKSPEGLNLDLCERLKFTEKFEMPIVEPIDCEPPPHIVAHYRLKNQKYFSNFVPHFYTTDENFQRLWNDVSQTMTELQRYPMVISPDFSVYLEMPMPMKEWNIFRNKLIAAIWQYSGLKVIPNISWTHFNLELSFDGYPKHSVITVNSTGISHCPRSKPLWEKDYQVMVETLQPKHILRYGPKLSGEYEEISTYYENNNKTSAENGWEQCIKG